MSTMLRESMDATVQLNSFQGGSKGMCYQVTTDENFWQFQDEATAVKLFEALETARDYINLAFNKG